MNMNWYRIKTSLIGLQRLATLSAEDKQACIDAYRFFQRMQAGEETRTEHETRAVADYYKVLNNVLSVLDLEKLHTPPQLDETRPGPRGRRRRAPVGGRVPRPAAARRPGVDRRGEGKDRRAELAHRGREALSGRSGRSDRGPGAPWRPRSTISRARTRSGT
jgi:hypothetical protein